jgi:hypothetical protein
MNKIILAGSLFASAFGIEMDTTKVGVQSMPKTIREKFLTELPEDENLMGVGTYPCVFKLGNSFYDYTKFKVA